MWNAWEHTESCLQTLRNTLAPGDQVVVVDNGSTDGTRAGLAGYRWCEVVVNEQNLGFARACNQGAARATGDVVVLLNNDTVLPAGWLDELLAPFDDPAVGATGPRSDNVSGPQQVEHVPYAPGDLAGLFEFAQEWGGRHHGRTTDIARLVGFCLAVRRSAFEQVGGFDERYAVGGYEDDDLCRRITALGLRLVVAEASFIHHHSHATFEANSIDWFALQEENRTRFEEKWGTDTARSPALLSACLIVKDEERMLPACLESVRDVVDEIIVYDTGSSDRTVELARAAGAQVFEGVWEDSFAIARNSALEHARGEWVLSIDADETLLANPSGLRSQLSDQRSGLEAFLVPIENLHGAGNSRSVHTALRVFRRSACTWRHRLHEQVGAKDDPGRALAVGYLSAARLLHHGYSAEVFGDRNKVERNLALALAAVEDGGPSHPYALMNYGRALETAGRSEEAVERLSEAVTTTPDPITKRLAVSNLINILGRLGRHEDALARVDELRRLSQSQIPADIAEGRTLIAMGEVVDGLALLARVPTRGRDDDGMEYGPHMVAAIRGEALASIGRFGEAADVVLEAVRSEGVLEADIGELVRWLLEAGRSPEEITAALAVEDLVPMLGRVLRQPPALADVLLNGAWERFPDRLEPLAAAARVAVGLPVARALIWSARLRARGLVSSCPLVQIVANTALEPELRVRAAAAAYGSFGEPRVVTAASEALDELDGERRAASVAEIGRLAPGLAALLASGVVPEAPEAEPPVASISPLPVAVAEERRGAAPRSQARHIAMWEVAATARRGGLNVVAPFEGTSAESDAARRLVTALRAERVAVSTTSYHWDRRDVTERWDHRDAGDFPYEVNLLVLSPDRMTDFVLDNGPASFEGRYVVGLWLWDLPAPPASLTNAARAVHEVWVPSRAAVSAFRAINAGRLHTIALPISTTTPISERAALGLPPGFVFSTVVDYDQGFERQNPAAAVASFASAFVPGDGCHLVVDAVHAERSPIEHAALLGLADGRPDITVVTGRTPAERDALIAVSDCYVSLGRADTTHAGVAKAMAWGTPTLTTSTEAARDFLSDGTSFLVDCTPVVCTADAGPGGGNGDVRWAEPDLEHAGALMRTVVADVDATARVARRARTAATRRYSERNAARFVSRRLADIDGRLHGNGGADRSPNGRARARA